MKLDKITTDDVIRKVYPRTYGTMLDNESSYPPGERRDLDRLRMTVGSHLTAIRDLTKEKA